METRQKLRELLGRATLLRVRGEHEKALEIAYEAVGIDHENWEAHELLGDLLVSVNRPEQALESYGRARELNRSRVALEDKIARAALKRAARLSAVALSQAYLDGTAKSDTVKRNPAYAALFSLLLPGLGQVYNGQLVKGMAMLFTFTLCFALSVLAVLRDFAARSPGPQGILYGPRIDTSVILSALFTGVTAIWVVLLLALWVYSVVDAAVRAGRTLTADDSGVV